MAKSPKLNKEGRAALLLARCDRWIDLRHHDDPSRYYGYGIPSSSRHGLYYICRASACDCPSFAVIVSVTGSAPPCAHMLAVQMHAQTLLDDIAHRAEGAPVESRLQTRRRLVRDIYRQHAQEQLSAQLTARQLASARYADIFSEPEAES